MKLLENLDEKTEIFLATSESTPLCYPLAEVGLFKKERRVILFGGGPSSSTNQP